MLWKGVSKKKGKDVEDGGESRYAVWIRDRQVVELQLQQMKMLRVSVGVMRMESEGQHTLDVLEAKSEFRGGTVGRRMLKTQL